MQWFAVFFGVYKGRFAPAAPEKTWRGKRTIPQRGGWRVGQNFYGCQDFLLLPLNVKNLANFGNIWKTLFNVVSLHKKINMPQTSIHIKPCKVISSEAHNKREKELDYVINSLSPNNEFWELIKGKPLASYVEETRRLVKEKTGRKMQLKAVPLHEAVVVINKSTTMDDLKRIAKRFKDRFGIEAVQIAIHRDEGKDAQHLNLHAHMVFDWYNHETGKSIRTSKADTSEMQTICAEELEMERGESSSKKHLDAQMYKAHAAAKELSELEQAKVEAEAELQILKIDIKRKKVWNSVLGALKATGDAITSLMGKSPVNKALNELKEKHGILEAKVKDLEKDVNAAFRNGEESACLKIAPAVFRSGFIPDKHSPADIVSKINDLRNEKEHAADQWELWRNHALELQEKLEPTGKNEQQQQLRGFRR